MKQVLRVACGLAIGSAWIGLVAAGVWQVYRWTMESPSPFHLFISSGATMVFCVIFYTIYLEP